MNYFLNLLNLKHKKGSFFDIESFVYAHMLNINRLSYIKSVGSWSGFPLYPYKLAIILNFI